MLSRKEISRDQLNELCRQAFERHFDLARKCEFDSGDTGRMAVLGEGTYVRFGSLVSFGDVDDRQRGAQAYAVI
jgi:hypothetical protein